MAKEQHVSVGVLEFESTQTIIVVLERLKELDTTRKEFGRQRVRIGDLEVSIPAGPAFLDVSLVIRQCSTPTSLNMIIALPRWTIPKKISPGSDP